MPQKPKISPEEKIKIVEDCINGKASVNVSAKKYGVGKESVHCWMRLYRKRGAIGLIPATKTRKYTIETKISAVEEYMTGKWSLRTICEKYDITQHSMLQNWITWYNSHREFKQPNSGGVNYMAKSRKTTLEERIEMVSHCISNNKDYSKTIEKYKVSYQQIYSWVRKYEQDGADALLDNRGKRKDASAITEIEKLNVQLKLKEAENNRLRMENELLKKLEALERGIDKN